MPPLAGRTAIVTGVSRRAGIGFAVAQRLAAMGANLAIHSWSPDDEGGVEQLLAELRGEGVAAEHMGADFARAGTAAAVVATARDRFGHVDIVVANHAHSSSGGLATVTEEEIDLC